ncbi:ATP-binding protein [Streptomyces sp. NPDC002851]
MNATTTPLTGKPVEWHLPRTPRSVPRARTLLHEQTAAWNLTPDVADTAALLLSELLTNAVTHARVPRGRQLRARCALLSDGTLRLEVDDANNSEPCPRKAAPEDESGRGLALVEALADRWGTTPRAYGIGKTVWCELGAAP